MQTKHTNKGVTTYQTFLKYSKPGNLKRFDERVGDKDYQNAYTYDNDDRTTKIDYTIRTHSGSSVTSKSDVGVSYTHGNLNRTSQRVIKNGSNSYTTRITRREEKWIELSSRSMSMKKETVVARDYGAFLKEAGFFYKHDHFYRVHDGQVILTVGCFLSNMRRPMFIFDAKSYGSGSVTEFLKGEGFSVFQLLWVWLNNEHDLARKIVGLHADEIKELYYAYFIARIFPWWERIQTVEQCHEFSLWKANQLARGGNPIYSPDCVWECLQMRKYDQAKAFAEQFLKENRMTSSVLDELEQVLSWINTSNGDAIEQAIKNRINACRGTCRDFFSQV